MILEKRTGRKVEPLAVDLLLLRSVLGTEIKIIPGRGLMAHVMSADGSGRGAISIAGAVIEAELPKHVRAGQDVRLVVKSVSEERVVLSLSEQQMLAPVAAAVDTAARGRQRSACSSAIRTSAVAQRRRTDGTRSTLRYERPRSAPIDLRFDLDPSSLRVAVTARRRASRCVGLRPTRSTCARRSRTIVDRTVGLKLAARREPLDVYA